MHRCRRVVGILLALVVCFLGLWWLQKDPDQSHQEQTSPPPGPQAPVRPVPQQPSAPVPRAEPIETFDTPGGLEPGAEQAIQDTAQAFVAAWLNPDPESRGEALRPYSTPALLEGLVHTRPDKIPGLTPHGHATLVRTGPWGAEARQQFTDHSAIALLLLPDPDSPTRWAVASVRSSHP